MQAGGESCQSAVTGISEKQHTVRAVPLSLAVPQHVLAMPWSLAAQGV